MRTITTALKNEAIRRDTTVIPPLSEILTVSALFVALMAVFVR